MTEIKEIRNKWEDLCSWILRVNIVKLEMPPPSKQSIDSMQLLSIFQWLFFFSEKEKLILKFTWKYKESSQNILEKKKDIRNSYFLISNLITKYSNKKMWY